MKLKYWIEVVKKSEPIYPIVKKFLEDELGQIGGYKSKSGNNEKEHCLLYWQSKNLEKDYECSKLWCHEMLLHIAASFNVPGEDLKLLDEKVRDYIRDNGRELKRPSIIAPPTMDAIKKTELYNYYASLE